MAITRTQIARQLQNRGGITNMSVRQHYGLGSIVKKAVKGVTKAAKDVVSSDLGKAALLAGGAYYLGGGNLFGLQRAGLSTPGFAFSNLPGAGFFTGGESTIGTLGNLTKGKNALVLGKGSGMGTGAKLLAGAAGLTGFLASQGLEAEEIESIKQDPEALKVYLRRYYTNLNPPTADTDADTYNKEVEDFVASQTAEYSTSFAKGGRVGLAEGVPRSGLGSLRGMGAGDEIVIERDLSKATEPKYNAKDFMIDKYNEEGIPPEIVGKGFQGDEKIFIIETPRGGTMMITEEDYIENFGRKYRRLGSPEEGEGIMMIEQREEIAGGPYTTGNDVKDAFGVWNNSDQGVKELYEGFIDFFKSGDWRDQIQGSKIKTKTKEVASAPNAFAELNMLAIDLFGRPYDQLNDSEQEILMEYGRGNKAEGGPINNIARMDFKVGEGVASLPLRQNKAGVKELDLRSTGGFIPPIGTKEKADDVPAMLSNNEFVFTADAVRAAGGGNVEKGAQRMYDTMKKLESRVG